MGGRFVTGIDKQTRVMYSSKDVGDTVSLAYALTVHKAQGAEYPVVVLPLVKDHFPMLHGLSCIRPFLGPNACWSSLVRPSCWRRPCGGRRRRSGGRPSHLGSLRT